MTLLLAIVAGLALTTAIAALVLAHRANAQALRTDALLAALLTKVNADSHETRGRVSEIRVLAREAVATATTAFEAAAAFRRGRRVTDPVAAPPPLPGS